MRAPANLAVYEAFLSEMAALLADPAAPGWHALPGEIARWWRQRGTYADDADTSPSSIARTAA